MFYVICYDITDDKIRNRVVKALKGYGYRVQKSVFECPNLTEHQLVELQRTLAALIDHGEDTIRYFRLCKTCLKNVEWTGLGMSPNTERCKII